MSIHPLVKKVTYSAEDNKLRIYVVDGDERFDAETYDTLKSHSFSWAPKQRFFGATWSPSREDVASSFGVIEAEDITLAERAENKIDRLHERAEKVNEVANIYASTAKRLSESFSQPILAGHHSQRKAEKIANQATKTAEKAEELQNQSQHWLNKAVGVARFANMKNDPKTRASRMKVLFADLRHHQRSLNHGNVITKLWTNIRSIADETKRARYIADYSGAYLGSGNVTFKASYDNCYNDFQNGTISHTEIIEKSIAHGQRLAQSLYHQRFVVHLLNRLAYERQFFGETQRFDGKLTTTIIKGFARDYGAHKPSCKEEKGIFTLSSTVDLPAFLQSEECAQTVKLTESDWLDLMQSCGFEPTIKKSSLPPILNFVADEIEVVRAGSVRKFRQVSMTKAEYSSIHSDGRGTLKSSCGNFRVKVSRDPESKEFWGGNWVAVFISDSKAHSLPDSPSVYTKICGAA
ncbi:DUF3560 domain-containing protein [Vibrio navarrensis]|nr:DUF3560 domain-containing protein [Vibrio navarrensis]